MAKYEIHIGTKIIGPMNESAWQQLGEGDHWQVVTELYPSIAAFLLEQPGFCGSFNPNDIYAVGDRLTIYEMNTLREHLGLSTSEQEYNQEPIRVIIE